MQLSRGAILFKEGEPVKKVYVVQTGLISLSVMRGEKPVEVAQVPANQVIGEYALAGILAHQYTATAMNDTRVLEVPVEILKPQMEQQGQLMKLIWKAYQERFKVTWGELRNAKMEKENVPCPAESVARVFGILFHLSKFQGTEAEGKVVVKWPAFRQYAQRVFLESPSRLEQAVMLLVKLKLAEFKKEKMEGEEEGPEVLTQVTFLNLRPIEEFFEFYQHFYYKGQLKFLKYDQKIAQFLSKVLEISANERIDRSGVVRMSYKAVLDKVKEDLGPTFGPEYFDRLELKGLFAKRESSQSGGTVSFHREEFAQRAQAWRFLREVEMWNEKGFVDLDELAPKKAVSSDAQTCTSCKEPIEAKQKFCGNCGTKVAAEAA